MGSVGQRSGARHNLRQKLNFMGKFNDFWLKIGDRVKIATPVDERTEAERPFERWRLGKLELPDD